MNLEPYITRNAKINSKWIKDFNIRHETIKFAEENIGERLHDIGLVNCFLDTKNRGNKGKNRQVGLHQTKKLLHSKRNNRQNGKVTYGMGEHICKPYIR